MSNRMRGLAAPAGEHGQPPVGFGSGHGGDSFCDLALEHQHQPVVPGRPWLDGEPGDQERGGDIVGQVRDDARAATREPLERIEVEGVAGHHIEAPGIARSDFRKRSHRAVIAFDCDDAACALRQ